eukprot:scaffold1800_cov332-Pavlova_lutheri.AAC.14
MGYAKGRRGTRPPLHPGQSMLPLVLRCTRRFGRAISSHAGREERFWDLPYPYISRSVPGSEAHPPQSHPTAACDGIVFQCDRSCVASPFCGGFFVCLPLWGFSWDAHVRCGDCFLIPHIAEGDPFGRNHEHPPSFGPGLGKEREDGDVFGLCIPFGRIAHGPVESHAIGQEVHLIPAHTHGSHRTVFCTHPNDVCTVHSGHSGVSDAFLCAFFARKQWMYALVEPPGGDASVSHQCDDPGGVGRAFHVFHTGVFHRFAGHGCSRCTVDVDPAVYVADEEQPLRGMMDHHSCVSGQSFTCDGSWIQEAPGHLPCLFLPRLLPTCASHGASFRTVPNRRMRPTRRNAKEGPRRSPRMNRTDPDLLLFEPGSRVQSKGKGKGGENHAAWDPARPQKGGGDGTRGRKVPLLALRACACVFVECKAMEQGVCHGWITHRSAEGRDRGEGKIEGWREHDARAGKGERQNFASSPHIHRKAQTVECRNGRGCAEGKEKVHGRIHTHRQISSNNGAPILHQPTVCTPTLTHALLGQRKTAAFHPALVKAGGAVQEQDGHQCCTKNG